jgi:hypothetical protein
MRAFHAMFPFLEMTVGENWARRISHDNIPAHEKKRAASKKNKEATTVRKSLRSVIESQKFIIDIR